jgi:hypothetical protein
MRGEARSICAFVDSSRTPKDPVWAPSGRELFYRNGDKMMVVDVSGKAAFRAERAGAFRRFLQVLLR